jgi:hypothetical protein
VALAAGQRRAAQPLAPLFSLSIILRQGQHGAAHQMDRFAGLSIALTDVLGFAALPRRAATGAHSSPQGWATPSPTA